MAEKGCIEKARPSELTEHELNTVVGGRRSEVKDSHDRYANL